MNIAALVNPVSEPPSRRSPSTSHVVPPSPATSVSKLPTPPLSTHKPMQHKRKRHDPKPIWAVREGEVVDGEVQKQQEQRQQSRPPSSTPRQQTQPPPVVNRNGPISNSFHAPQTVAAHELTGYERPVSDDPHVYDDIARKVCDFIWTTVVDNSLVRNAIAESDNTQVEIEARWGQIIDRQTGSRLRGIHETECVMRNGVVDSKFESTMTMEQHKKMNMYLNNQVQQSKQPGAARATVDYRHTREVDMFYELNQEGFNLMPGLIQQLIKQSQTRQRIRVTRDAKTGNVLHKIIKHRIANLEISSPQTEWDYRIGVNLEITYPGPIETLAPAVEPGKTAEGMERKKDRVSYSWLGAYQVDLTQVVQGPNKNHELELELNSQVLLENGDNVRKKEMNSFESLITGMMNNLRVLSREITPAQQAA